MSKILAIAFLLCVAIQATVPYGDNPDPLRLPVGHLRVKGSSILEALEQLRSAVGPRRIIFSLEVVPFEKMPDKNLTLEISDTTVGEALQSIVAQDSRYEFEAVDSKLVHVLPRGARGNATDLLNVQVKNLTLDKGYDEILRYPEQAIPELQAEVLRRLRSSGFVGVIATDPTAPSVKLSLLAGTVRDVLNQAAAGTDAFKDRSRSGWVYTFHVDPQRPLGGFPHWDTF